MSLRDRILSDLKDAMRAKDDTRVSTLRLIQAAIKDRDIAARAEDRCEGCCVNEIQAILQKLLNCSVQVCVIVCGMNANSFYWTTHWN